MTRVLLIYPYFRPVRDRTIFRFPPLGLSYVASALRAKGYGVKILDCTFLSRKEALSEALAQRADVVGIYSMITMREDALMFAKELLSAPLLIAGGPSPSSDPESYLQCFDAVVRGEGEMTAVELLSAWEKGAPLAEVPGVVARPDGIARGPRVEKGAYGPERRLLPDLDSLPFPARDLLPNADYIRHARMKHGYSITSVMTTRGCPFDCEFCSNVVFGVSYRKRSAESVVEEVAHALSLGYDRIHFADDVFTLSRERVSEVCGSILGRKLHFGWECLCRVDGLDRELAGLMKKAGCRRVFFGIESGSPDTLKLMNKKITPDRARRAIEAARSAGLSTGAFFILYYPGETERSVRETLRFATSLPLDYLSFTMPYPIPGTRLYERIKDRAIYGWKQPEGVFFDHVRVFDSDYSQLKMRAGILKGEIEFTLRRRFGGIGSAAAKLLEKPTDLMLTLLK